MIIIIIMEGLLIVISISSLATTFCKDDNFRQRHISDFSFPLFKIFNKLIDGVSKFSSKELHIVDSKY